MAILFGITNDDEATILTSSLYFRKVILVIAQFHLKIVQLSHQMELRCPSGDTCQQEKRDRINLMFETYGKWYRTNVVCFVKNNSQ